MKPNNARIDCKLEWIFVCLILLLFVNAVRTCKENGSIELLHTENSETNVA